MQNGSYTHSSVSVSAVSVSAQVNAMLQLGGTEK